MIVIIWPIKYHPGRLPMDMNLHLVANLPWGGEQLYILLCHIILSHNIIMSYYHIIVSYYTNIYLIA